MELISLSNVSQKSKVGLLNGLGYSVKGNYIFDSVGNKVKDKYMDIFVRVDKMMIMPGSTIILDDNELSVALYLEEYGSGS